MQNWLALSLCLALYGHCCSAAAPDFFQVEVNTQLGTATFNVTRSWSPHGVDHFYDLVQAGFYDDCAFFRVITGFVAQWGINGTPSVNEKWNGTIADDPVVKSNLRGFVSYAMDSNPDSRTTQIFVNYADNSRLDAEGFAPFAVVSEADMALFDKLYAGYGEQPDQELIYRDGNPYLKQHFPKLTYLVTARLKK